MRILDRGKRNWSRFWAGTRLPARSWYALSIAATMIGIGLYKGINLLVLVGYVVPVVIFFNARSTLRCIPNLVVRRRVVGSLIAGTAGEMELHVHNQDTVPALPLLLQNRGPEHDFTWRVPPLAPAAKLVLRGRLLPERRGHYAAGTLDVVSLYPFGLVERHVPMIADEDWIVLPRMGSLNRAGFRRFLRGHDGRAQRARTNPRRHPSARDEFHGLRPFRSGDSPRAIHWRTSARRNELMVREYEEFAGENLVLIFDPGMPAEASDSRNCFEAAVSLAATVASEWCRRRGDKFALIALGSSAAILDGATGPDLGRRVLERLALSESELACQEDGGLEFLGEPGLAAGPAVLISARGGVLADRLGRLLRRSVTVLDVGNQLSYDFYQPPSSSMVVPYVEVPPSSGFRPKTP